MRLSHRAPNDRATLIGLPRPVKLGPRRLSVVVDVVNARVVAVVRAGFDREHRDAGVLREARCHDHAREACSGSDRAFCGKEGGARTTADHDVVKLLAIRAICRVRDAGRAPGEGRRARAGRRRENERQEP